MIDAKIALENGKLLLKLPVLPGMSYAIEMELSDAQRKELASAFAEYEHLKLLMNHQGTKQ